MRTIPWGDRAAFNAAFVLQHYLPGVDAVRRAREAAHRRIVEHVQSQGSARVYPIERVRGLTPEEFRSRYLHKNIPVVLEGAARDWRCSREWSFEAFKRRFGHETIQLVDRPGLTDDDYVDESELAQDVVFGEFLDQVLAGGRKYMRFSPLLQKFPELEDDFDQEFLRRMPDLSLGIIPQVFIGGAGTYTPLHNAITPFLFVNVKGIKHWVIVPNRYLAVLNPAADARGYNHSDADVQHPDVAGFPGLDCVDRMEVALGPGDVLFVPGWAWHSVRNESPTIGVRCGMLRPTGMIGASLTLSFIRFFVPGHDSLPTAGSVTSVQKAINAMKRHARVMASLAGK